MGRYYDMVKANYNKLRNDESIMWENIKMWDKHLEKMQEHHPDMYWEIMRRTHEMIYGKHFDEEYAKWQVKQMRHKGDDGKEYKGEHWSLEQTNDVLAKQRSKVPAEYNEFDFYVALNAQYHDTICVAKKYFNDDVMAGTYIIDEAIAVWFNDSDWPTGKVWEYFAKN